MVARRNQSSAALHFLKPLVLAGDNKRLALLTCACDTLHRKWILEAMFMHEKGLYNCHPKLGALRGVNNRLDIYGRLFNRVLPFCQNAFRKEILQKERLT